MALGAFCLCRTTFSLKSLDRSSRNVGKNTKRYDAISAFSSCAHTKYEIKKSIPEPSLHFLPLPWPQPHIHSYFNCNIPTQRTYALSGCEFREYKKGLFKLVRGRVEDLGQFLKAFKGVLDRAMINLQQRSRYTRHYIRMLKLEF